MMQQLPYRFPRRKGLQRKYHRSHVHSLGHRCALQRCMCAPRQQALYFTLEEARRSSSPRSTSHPYDVVVLAHSSRLVHLRMDILPKSPLDRSRYRRFPCRIRIHLPLQLREQLLGRLVSAPSCIRVGGEDVYPVVLGCRRRLVHRPNVRRSPSLTSLFRRLTHRVTLIGTID